MYRDHTIGVIVPAYNEEAYVGEVLATIPSFVDRIYVVDDCSTDRTWEIVQEWAAVDSGDEPDGTTPKIGEATPMQPSIADGGISSAPRIVPIRHATNQGAGAALRTGYLRAREDGVDVTVTMDADGQMDPDQLPSLLDPIVEGEADYAKGNRLATTADRRAMPPFRLFGNWLLTQLTRVASGYWHLQDPQNGYTAITHEALSAIDVEDLPDDHDYPNDLLVRLHVAGMRVADVSMPAVYGDEESTIRYRTFVPRTSVTLLGGFFRRMLAETRNARSVPTPAWYGLALLAGVATVASGVVTAANGFAGSSSTRGGFGILLGVVASVGLLAVAVVRDARSNEDREVRR